MGFIRNLRERLDFTKSLRIMLVEPKTIFLWLIFSMMPDNIYITRNVLRFLR